MDVLLAWVEVWKMGSSLVLHFIRVLFLGQTLPGLLYPGSAAQWCALDLSHCLTTALWHCLHSRVPHLVLSLCFPAKEKTPRKVSWWVFEQEKGLCGQEWEEAFGWSQLLMKQQPVIWVCWWLSQFLFWLIILFGSRLWQHLWKTTQSTWFHQCSRSCPSSGTPSQKVLLYILGSECVYLESNETNSVMTWLLEKHNSWSALPCQTKQELSVPSGGSIKFLFA